MNNLPYGNPLHWEYDAEGLITLINCSTGEKFCIKPTDPIDPESEVVKGLATWTGLPLPSIQTLRYLSETLKNHRLAFKHHGSFKVTCRHKEDIDRG